MNRSRPAFALRLARSPQVERRDGGELPLAPAWMQHAAATFAIGWRENYLMRAPVRAGLRGLPAAVPPRLGEGP